MANAPGAAGGTPRSLAPEKYTVGWICAIPTELIAAKAMLDELHGPLKAQPMHDGNNYTLGRIRDHDIVLACLPRYGTNDAAVAGISMQRTFPSLRFGLMVGVGGGIPSPANDIRLGDIAVSVPSGQAGGVIQYDMGKKEDGGFRRTGSLNSPPTLLLTAIATLRATRNLGKEITALVNGAFPDDDDDDEEEWRFPSNATDILFEETDETSSDGSNQERTKVRDPRKSCNPQCFYGNIGSGNSVIKNTEERRLLAADGNLICFEMEAVGLMNFFKCIVIRGICDYADKHKHKRWQPYAAAVAAAYAKKLLTIVSGEAVENLEPVKKNQHWMVPRQINPHFTGRTKVLQTLREKLCTEKDHANEKIQKRFIICGMGGSGKSEVCLKFAHENRDRFWGVFWIDASDEDSIKRGITDAAKFASNGAITAYADAKLWFENLNKSWLLIFDNADNTDLNYLKFFPSGDSGCILMSTRVPECQKYNTVGYQDADFEKLGVDKSIELLLKSAGIPNEKWDHAFEHALKVVSDEFLGQHALAITQAGAFVGQGLCKLEEYTIMFNNQRATLLKHRQRQAESQYGDVYATFEVSAEALKLSHREDWLDALELLNVLAFYHREGIPEDMFIKAWTKAMEATEDWEESIGLPSLWNVDRMRRLLHPSPNSPMELDLLSLRKARSALQSFSLVAIHPETGDVSMHPLVHAWARDRLSADAQTMAWSTAASILSLSIETLEYHEFMHKIQPHIEFCVGPAPELLFTDSKYTVLQIGKILYRFTFVLYRLRTGSLAEAIAEVLVSRLVQEAPLQSEVSRNVLYLQALCKWQVAKYKETVQLVERVILFDEENHVPLPPENWGSIHARELLGQGYSELGRHSEAIIVLEKVSQLRQKFLGLRHRSSLTTLHTLACAYFDNGQVEKAINIFEEVVQVETKTLPFTHPERLASQHELACAYLDDGQVKNAINNFEEVVQVRRKTLPLTHSDRLGSLHSLARAYLRNGQVEIAISIFEEVVQVREKTLSSTHNERLVSQQELARAYCIHGEYKRALPILQEVVGIRSKQDYPGYLPRVYAEGVLSACLSAIERNV